MIEGDQQTDRDAKRIAETGVPVLQINTGKTCHLDAHRIGHALTEIAPKENSLLLIENIGNLVCPALFDLGEKSKIVILSVTEGDDKPLKYPLIFSICEVLIINKLDYFVMEDFNLENITERARTLNEEIKLFPLSCKTSIGIEKWIRWIYQEISTF